jgi:heme oxygenase
MIGRDEPARARRAMPRRGAGAGTIAPWSDAGATPGTGGERAVVLLPAETVRGRLAGLRRRTAHLHDMVERRVDIGGRLGSVDRYADLLARLYGFYEPFEAHLGTAAARWGLPLDFDARRKAPLIARDLADLGLTAPAVEALPRCGWEPPSGGPAPALGCLYVVEGATLGGRLIARDAERRLGLGPGTGGAFFMAYGADLGPRWRTFCSVLAGASSTPVAEGEIVAAACDTFAAFGCWLAAGDVD